ncbi:MAG: RsmD family RNA methyltransferase [Acidobacteriota bacterium]|nr:RsmD family RNA methyltransferase [Acidobacteriota bacterium]
MTGIDLELTIERAAQGGRMIARDPSSAGQGGAGAVVLVAGAIPGERVRARVTERRQGVTFAETIEVLEASPDRREPPFDPQCGGNLLAHVAYARQLELKREMLADAFRRQARLPLTDLPPITGSPETGYRMRARLHISGGRIGFYRERSRDVCDAVRTGQLSPGAAQVLEAAGGALAPLSEFIEEIVLAENVAADTRLMHVALKAGAPDLEPAALLRAVPGLSAAGTIDERLPGGGVLSRHAASFFQANRFLLATLASKVVDAAGEGPLVDLFAGVGLFAVEAASRGIDVIAVENDPISGVDLTANLACFGAGAEAVRHSVETWLRHTRAVDGPVVVDPPRTGLSAEARAALLALSPRRVVYVSCDPVTLARDVKEFLGRGYQLVQLEVLDLFPNTPHVESIAVLVRA